MLNKQEVVRDHLEAALDNLLAALALSGANLAEDVPGEGLDTAMASDPAVRTALQTLDVALRAVESADDRHLALLNAEEAVNALVAAAADAAYRVGVRVGQGLRG